MAFEDVFTTPVTDASKQMPGYLRIKGGITMDTGSAAFVMPTKWLPMFALDDSEGNRSGPQYIGVLCNAEVIEGQKVVDFVTKDHASRRLAFQCADVSNMLARASGIFGAGN